MSRLILFEDCPDWFEQDEQDLLVALTPQACYLLSRRHKEYHVVSEFGTESELARVEDRYWEEQLVWFDQFDDLLWQELPKLRETGIRPAYLYGYFLKVCLDNLFIRGLEIAALLRRGHRQVVLWRREASESSLDWTLFFRGPSVYSRLLPIFCRKLQVDYKECLIPAPDTFQSQGQKASVLGFTVPKRLLSKVKGVLSRRWQFDGTAFRTVTPTRESPLVSQRPLTLLFLKTSYDMGHLLRAAQRSGHRCLLRNENEVVDGTGFFRKTIAKLNHGLSDNTFFEANLEGSEWARVAEIIGASDHVLWQWPDGWHNVPMADVLIPQFKYWVSSVLPVLVSQSHEWLHIYKDEGVDFVVTPTLWDLADYSAIAAGQMSDSTESVYVIHGDGAFAVKVHDLINLFHFDHCFASHYEPAEYFRKRNVSYARPTAQVHVGSYRWRVNARLARRRLICLERAGDSIRLNMWSPPEKISGSLPIVVYLVTATGWDTRYLNSAWYPDTWYYQLQTRIIDSVVGKDHYTFVVKLFPGDERLSKPIVEHVRDLPARNIHTSRAPFSQWLPWADRVIVDFPSTGLYEAAVAGVPFHLLLYEKIKVRTTALERLRPWTTVFSKPEEAVEAVDRFLHASVKREAIIHHEENEILSTLESLVAKKPV